ncbi:hypothetical protein ACTHP5_20395 [Bacillus subtilis]|uniref:hypothetical protein n=1 Tax=Bacillus subtilis group TaxID=653685 RepID=UPI000DC1E942|nr:MULTISPECIES: hypothetical protein [Bacillus subtilis group]AWX21961.1 hypothetical protein CXF51_10480 [Bacillus subtilis subsp. subtilis]MCA1233338.1 hypothetical protein [Bacillus velezensis]MCA1311438.1 hypothetical protein [Bacillus velezensis]MCA1330325.1 hypothetical protein [Bacillus velezensis]MCX4184268.1 hypothetical protein [Bacillus amyloliquefaciens]
MRKRLIGQYLRAVQNRKHKKGNMNEFEIAGQYLCRIKEFQWDSSMDENKDFWMKVKKLVDENR